MLIWGECPIIWNWAQWACSFSIKNFCLFYLGFLNNQTKESSISGPQFTSYDFSKCVFVTMALFSVGNLGLAFGNLCWLRILTGVEAVINLLLRVSVGMLNLVVHCVFQVLWELWYQTWHLSSVTYSQRRAWRGNLLAGWTTMLVYLWCLS